MRPRSPSSAPFSIEGLTRNENGSVQLKNKKFKRALECTQEALKIDENNAKAKFREAQARIGLGELSKGKAILEELQKVRLLLSAVSVAAKSDPDAFVPPRPSRRVPTSRSRSTFSSSFSHVRSV